MNKEQQKRLADIKSAMDIQFDSATPEMLAGEIEMLKVVEKNIQKRIEDSTPPPPPIEKYKHTIVIWAEHDESKQGIASVAYGAEDGRAHCSRFSVEKVEDPSSDPDWDGTELFD